MSERELVYISDSSIPSYSADSIHVMKMCQAFSNQGYKVTLLGKRTRNNVKTVFDIYSFYGVNECFEIKLFPFKAFFSSGRLYNILLPFFSLKPNTLTYTRSIYASFWYSVFGKSIVFEIHEPFSSKGKWLGFLFRYIVRKGLVNKWVVISIPLKDHLINEFGIKSNSILVAHDGADIDRNPSLKKNVSGKNLKVGYVGSLYQGKGMEIIFQLSKRIKNLDFHIVGGSDEQIDFWKGQLEEEHKNLIFHGYQPPKDTKEFISQFDILLAPYQREVYVKKSKKANNLSKWMSPLKIFEYMAIGKPILASDLEVIREILVHNQTALLCDPNDLKDWEASIEKLVKSPTLVKQLGNSARNVLENKFTWDIRSKHILDFINNY